MIQKGRTKYYVKCRKKNGKWGKERVKKTDRIGFFRALQLISVADSNPFGSV